MIGRFAGALLLLTLPGALRAQHGGGAPPMSRVAPADARQFDFLIGQWEIAVKPKATTLAQRIHGAPRLVGTWKAWPALDGWGVEDELRIMDGSGNPIALSHTLRAYDGTARRWLISSYDPYGARRTAASAAWTGGEMALEGRNPGADGGEHLTRTRFTRITATGFVLRQDRSEDGGKTWTRDYLTIEATRVAAEAPR